MLYRTLGRTGLEVSVLGYGASPLGNEFSTIDPAEGRRAVRQAIDLGINYFDVSPYYGRTLAETRLGEALEGRRTEVILATKAGRYGVNLPDGFDFSAERITRSVEESLRRLRTDYFDVFQVHDIEFGDRNQIIEETLPAMFRLREQGKVRFVGITAYPLQILAQVAARLPVDTILSYCRYDLLDTGLETTLLPLAKERGIGLINGSPLHMGALTDKGVPAWHPAPRRVLAACQEAAAFCRARGADIADLALQFALAEPAVATTLVGMSKVTHVERNVRLVGTTADPELLAGVKDILRPVMNAVWLEGRLENNDPGAVPKQS
ncbi:MAG TPA: aldo/keto reductase [Anaerolineae bacterium]